MSYKTCPDWPALMELAPGLQFKHMTVREAQLPFEIVGKIPEGVSLDEVEICCDVDHHVVNAAHTHGCRRGPRGHALVRGSGVGVVKAGADSASAPHAA